MSSKDNWHQADQREQPPVGAHIPPPPSQPGRHSPGAIHRYPPPANTSGAFYPQGPPQAGPQAAPQPPSALPQLPSISAGQPPFPLPSLQNAPAIAQQPPPPHLLERPPQHENRPSLGQLPQLASPPLGLAPQQQQQPPPPPPHPIHFTASNAPPLSQAPVGVASDRLPAMPPNAPPPLTNPQAHALQAIGQLPPQAVVAPPSHSEAVANLVSAPQPSIINAPVAPGQGNIPASYRPLNVKDALSYLDQVKVQFSDHPDVYNRFLDIMKDFKSQAIDTPGVIERVSSLFAGHPNLIQGFNTFLPPGYRIECSTDPSDPHSIRVTTPQGTTTATSAGQPQTLHLQPGPVPPGGPGWRAQDAWGESNPTYRFEGDRTGPPGQSPAGQGRPPHPIGPGQVHLQQPQPLQPAMGQPGSASDAVSQLQSVAAATNGAGPLAAAAMRQQPGGPLMGQQPVQAGPLTPGADVKRGPVEFNHAISYVNKIKTRFSSQPEIYKNFLEILQTYQRESKPIQEVYSQVTQLFNSAPDLLEDFKQFLPESAAQARQKADDQGRDLLGNGAGIAGRGPPPQGHFAPPLSVTKGENKRKRPQQPTTSSVRDSGVPPLPPNIPINNDIAMGGTGPSPSGRGVNANKRPKTTHKPSDVPVSPTLIPANPEPLIQNPAQTSTQDEIAFFDRVRKYIGNKQTYNEFLKMLNMFSSDLLDKSLLLVNIENFLGTNPELFAWAKRFLKINDKPEDQVQNALRKGSKVRLSVCRSLGPSYRLLPKLEATKACSGRDEMCWEVLNDQWASHPTWASEDSGFVGHKKNQYEEMLHRIEEERHDYDFNIEANLRTIQLLEPIAQRIASMSQEEQENFKLGPGLGGQSRTIYQRVIKKVYDKELGLEIIKEMHERPALVVPIVLRRLKQKDEEWRLAQREWNKIWREQTSKIFYKSLDHQGISVKGNDKRFVTNKHFISEIQSLYNEEKKQQEKMDEPIDKTYQLKYSITDLDVLMDICRLLAAQLDKEGAYSNSDRLKIASFIKNFIPAFFGVGKDEVENSMGSISGKSPGDEDTDMDYSESPSGRSTRRKTESNLLQDVLKRPRNGKATRKDGSAYSGSRGSTPELSNEDDAMEDVTMDHEPMPPNAPATWLNQTSGLRKSLSEIQMAAAARDAKDVLPSELKDRQSFNLFGNSNIYCFMRILQLIYQRLVEVKNSEAGARKMLELRAQHKASHELGLTSLPSADDFFNVSPDANYYNQVLDHCERLIQGQIESGVFEEGLRSVYIMKGWQLYTIDKHVVSMNKMIQGFVSDSRDNSGEILKLFDRDRSEEKTNYQLQMSYRKEVEMYIGKDEPTYRIEWNPDLREMAIQLLFRVDPTHTAKLTKDEKWAYYIDSYIMAQPTEGVPLPPRAPFLLRNLPTQEAVDSFNIRDCELNGVYNYKKAVVSEGLELKICVNTYKMFFTPQTTDAVILSGEQRLKFSNSERSAKRRRLDAFNTKFVANEEVKNGSADNRVLGWEGVPGLWKP